jgi:hypothetical protein
MVRSSPFIPSCITRPHHPLPLASAIACPLPRSHRLHPSLPIACPLPRASAPHAAFLNPLGRAVLQMDVNSDASAATLSPILTSSIWGSISHPKVRQTSNAICSSTLRIMSPSCYHPGSSQSLRPPHHLLPAARNPQGHVSLSFYSPCM